MGSKVSAGSKLDSANPADGGSLIGRRVGRNSKNVGEALKRPEKKRRDAYVDTAAEGMAADDRRAGGPYTARRNSKKRDAGMAYTLEDSRTGTPSRKSTRRSANHIKAASQLTRRAKGRVHAPQNVARRAQVRPS